MQRNALGRGLEGSPNDQATRKGAGEGAAKDNATNNAGTQRDGTPTNIGAAAPSNPGTRFFKQPAPAVNSGMEAALGKLADKTHKR